MECHEDIEETVVAYLERVSASEDPLQGKDVEVLTKQV
jgi:hypothetical protein